MKYRWLFFISVVCGCILVVSDAFADTQMFKREDTARAYADKLQDAIKNTLWRFAGDLNYVKTSTCSVIRPESELSLQFDSAGDGSVDGKSFGTIGPAKISFDYTKAKRMFRTRAIAQAEAACRLNEAPGSDWSADASLQITVITAPEGALVSTNLFRMADGVRSRYDVKFLDNNTKMRVRVTEIGAGRIFDKIK